MGRWVGLLLVGAVAGCAGPAVEVAPDAPSASRTGVPAPVDVSRLDIDRLLVEDRQVPQEVRELSISCTSCVTNPANTADITKDGYPDLLVTLDHDDPPRQGYLLFTMVEGRPRLLMSWYGVDGVARVKDGDLHLEEQWCPRQDPSCAHTPPVVRTRRWTWTGHALRPVQDSGVPTGRVPRDGLGHLTLYAADPAATTSPSLAPTRS